MFPLRITLSAYSAGLSNIKSYLDPDIYSESAFCSTFPPEFLSIDGSTELLKRNF